MRPLPVDVPRVPLLGAAETPLLPAPRLSEALGVQIWCKRDDLTAVGFGGNKLRNLEFLLADAIARGADCLVTGAGPQSNWAMLAAVTARTHGLEPYLVHYGDPAPLTGNRLLTELVGTWVRFTGDAERASVDDGIAALAAELTAQGRTPYVLPRGGATALGALGYVRAAAELAHQYQRLGLAPRQLWLATGSCGTQAGLVAGREWLGEGPEVVGVTVSRPVAECRDRIDTLRRGALERIGVQPGDEVATLRDDQLASGYGPTSATAHAAIELVARTEGVFLDPTFCGKAAASLVAACRGGEVAGPVVLLVSGGGPTLFTGAIRTAMATEVDA